MFDQAKKKMLIHHPSIKHQVNQHEEKKRLNGIEKETIQANKVLLGYKFNKAY